MNPHSAILGPTPQPLAHDVSGAAISVSANAARKLHQLAGWRIHRPGLLASRHLSESINFAQNVHHRRVVEQPDLDGGSRRRTNSGLAKSQIAAHSDPRPRGGVPPRAEIWYTLFRL